MAPLHSIYGYFLLYYTLQPGSYDLSSGCIPCQCNVGGSVSQVCERDSSNGQCRCKPNVQGTLCTAPTPGFFFTTLDTFLVEAEDVTPLPVSICGSMLQ